MQPAVGDSLGMTPAPRYHDDAMLGDGPVLMLDKPVKQSRRRGRPLGRDLHRPLTSKGRTICMSHHLMSEMTVTADHLIVVCRGTLIASASTPSSSSAVRNSRSGRFAER